MPFQAFHARRGAADVGHGQQVQRREVALVAHAAREGADHLGVAQVLLLRHLAHHQVLGDQELDQLRVFARDAVLLAEARHVARAQRGMVAAAALGDVVEQRGHVQQPGLVPAGRELRAERVLVGVLGDEEAPHVAQHHQDVLVDRVDVEQVVLHLPHDAAEHAQVAPQHRGLVHQPEGMRDAVGLLQHPHEGVVVRRVVAELAVHHMARVVERAQRARRQALHADGLLVEQEGLEDRVRLALVEVVARDLDQAGALEEALVDRRRLLVDRLQPLRDVEQQDLVELRDRLGGPVVAPHQRLARLALRFAHVAEARGHRGLQVEHQPVLAPVGDHVQPRADQRQQRLVALDLLRLEGRGQAVARQVVPAAAEARGLGDPEDGLQVAQAARRFLAVGLERVGRVVELLVPVPHLLRLGDEEGLRVDHRAEALAEGGEQLLVARDQPRLEQRGLDRDVLLGLGQAFLDGAHARADLQAGVPALADEGLEPRRLDRLLAALGRQQQQHVDVGVGEQLAAPVAADRHQRQAVAEIGVLPQRLQVLVGQRRELAQHRVHAARGRAREAQGLEKGELLRAVGFAQRRDVVSGGFDHGGGVARPAARLMS